MWQSYSNIYYDLVAHLSFFVVAVPLTAHTVFGMGTGMIVEQVRCNGAEMRITDCTFRDVPDGECNHNENAGVRCCKYNN